MRSEPSRSELEGADGAKAKYGLIVAALCAATLTVALAIASKLAALPVNFIG